MTLCFDAAHQWHHSPILNVKDGRTHDWRH
jgi:hypothetical protein